MKTEEVREGKIFGTYTLLLHGNRFGGDIENIVIFDIESDKYTFEIFAPEFDYQIIKGLSGDEALKRAEDFVRRHILFKRSQLSKIFDNEGNLIGYELRPLYFSSAFMTDDVLDVDYRIKGDKVVVRIEVNPFLMKKRFLERHRFH
ncbi:MAG: hypothetical protein N2257_07780 [Thermodesulfovibrionales bacterium]|nr:hypothetical protein [Thermodesulfovibrionales bacterium]